MQLASGLQVHIPEGDDHGGDVEGQQWFDDGAGGEVVPVEMELVPANINTPTLTRAFTELDGGVEFIKSFTAATTVPTSPLSRARTSGLGLGAREQLWGEQNSGTWRERLLWRAFGEKRTELIQAILCAKEWLCFTIFIT